PRATTAALPLPAPEAPSGGPVRPSSQAPAGEPSARPETSQAGTPARVSSRLNATDPRPNPSIRTHTSQRGDTLYSLARRYNTSVDALRKLNNLKNSSLSTGQRLRVPGTEVQG